MDNYIRFNENIILKILDPNKMHVILNSDYAKRYMGYLLIMEDLKRVLTAVDELKIDGHQSIVRESLTFYIVVTYGKVFSKADVRKVKLEKSQLKDLKKDLITYHDIIIDLRNKHVAHAGSEIFTVNNLVAQVENTNIAIFLSGLNLSSFNYNLNSVKELVEEVLLICETKAEKAYEILRQNFLTNKEIENNSFLPSEFEIYSFEEIKDTLTALTLDFYENKQ